MNIKNSELFFQIFFSISMFIVAGMSYWWSTTMSSDIYRTEKQENLYQGLAEGTIEVPKEKWMAFLKADIEARQSLKKLSETNSEGARGIAIFLVMFGVFEACLVVSIDRRG